MRKVWKAGQRHQMSSAAAILVASCSCPIHTYKESSDDNPHTSGKWPRTSDISFRGFIILAIHTHKESSDDNLRTSGSTSDVIIIAYTGKLRFPSSTNVLFFLLVGNRMIMQMPSLTVRERCKPLG